MSKVLLVEDDNNLREIYEARLIAEGYDIITAQNGEEALVVAKQNKPDLVISDVMMPRISGFEMLDILRNTEELKNTKVIMLTALGQAEDQKRADNLGADKYLVKSQVTLEDIVNAAKELLGQLAATTEPAAVEAVAAPAPSTPTAVVSANPAPVPEPVVATSTSVPESVAAAPIAAPVAEPPVPAPALSTTAPASITPQATTTVVVPPAPANPAPPVVTAVPTPVPEPVTPAPVVSEPPVAAPVAQAPVPPEPAPEPSIPVVVRPVEEPIGTPPSAAVSGTAVPDAAAQTMAAEEAALQQQIDSYASAPAEATPMVEPAPVNDAASSNAETINEAVEQLNNPIPEPPLQPPSVTSQPTPISSESVAPQPEAPVVAAPPPTPAATSTSDNVSVVGKKVIQPINTDFSKPSLDELLAKEEAKDGPPPAAPVVNGSPASAQDEVPINKPGDKIDPNVVAL